MLRPNFTRVLQLASDVRLACTTAGFFFLTGHGIPAAVLDAAFEASRAFFALPIEASVLLCHSIMYLTLIFGYKTIMM